VQRFFVTEVEFHTAQMCGAIVISPLTGRVNTVSLELRHCAQHVNAYTLGNLNIQIHVLIVSCMPGSKTAEECLLERIINHRAFPLTAICTSVVFAQLIVMKSLLRPRQH
jgi:hypothetical protein